jgi:hypothetical protein
MRRVGVIAAVLFSLNGAIAQRQGLYFPNRSAVVAMAYQSDRDTLQVVGFFPLPTAFRYSERDTSNSRRSWLHNALFREHFLTLDTGEVYLTIDPAFNGEVGIDLANKNNGGKDRDWYYTNTRGIVAKGNITKKVGFESSIYENQAVFVDYLDQYITRYQVVPGQGRVKTFKDGFDYSMSSGKVYYLLSPTIVLQAGHGKNFVGEGYRSMVLSDNAFNYPFFRVDLQFFRGKLGYSWMVASLQELYRLPSGPGSEPPFLRKTLNFHYLSWLPHPKWRIGVSETMLFQATDTLGKSKFNGQSITPLPGMNTGHYGLEAQANGMLAAHLAYQWKPTVKLYSQVVWGDSDLKQLGLQMGVNYRANRNAFFRMEFNGAFDGLYSENQEFNGFVHYNQFMAHPAGNDFSELAGMAFLRTNRWFTELKLNYLDYHSSAILIQDGMHTAYGQNTDVMNQQIGIGWMVNPVSGMHVKLGVNNRMNVLNRLDNTAYFYVGFRSNLTSSYYDF